MKQTDRKQHEERKATSSDLDYNLWISLDHARSALSRARELELAHYSLTNEQAALLHTLVTKGGSATNIEISDTMIRQYNTITTLARRSEKLGLVKRTKQSVGKKMLVTITPHGLNIYQKLTRNSIIMALSEIDPDEKQQLSLLLDRVTTKVRNMLLMDEKLSFLP